MAKPLLKLDDLLKAGNNINELAISLADRLQEVKGNWDKLAGRLYSTKVFGGVDPSLISWFNSIRGDKPYDQFIQDQFSKAKKTGDAVRKGIADGSLAPDGNTWSDYNRVQAQNKKADEEYEARSLSNLPAGSTGVNDVMNAAQNVSRSLQDLTDRGYGNTDLSQLPQGADISSLPNVQGVPQDVLNQALQNLTSQGLAINPNKNLTELDVAEFLKRAEREVEPYYASMLKLGRESYLQAAGYNKQSILENEAKLEKKYGKDLRTLSENAAETGFAQSGRRILDEKDLATEYGSQINEGRRKLAFDETARAMTFAEKFGSSNLPRSLSIGEAPSVTPGAGTFGKANRNLPLYNLDSNILDNIIGSQEKEKATGTRELAQYYEGIERSKRTLPI